jgi:hypothetical protein
MTITTRPAVSRARWIALAALTIWALVHVIGGITLLVADTNDGLETLGPNAAGTVPTDPGDAAEALLRFHSLNIALGGIGVLALTAAWWRTCNRWQLDIAVAVAAALDVGLIAFFVIPDVLPATQGLIGPVLVVIAIAGAIGVHRLQQPNPAIT